MVEKANLLKIKEEVEDEKVREFIKELKEIVAKSKLERDNNSYIGEWYRLLGALKRKYNLELGMPTKVELGKLSILIFYDDHYLAELIITYASRDGVYRLVPPQQ